MLSTLFAALLFSADASVVRLDRNVVRPSLPIEIHPVLDEQGAFVLKFAEGSQVRLALGALACAERPIEVAACRDVLSGTVVEPYFTRPVAELEAERSLAVSRTPADQPLPADLCNYFRVRTGGAEQSAALIDELSEHAIVEVAYPEPSRDALVMIDNDIAPPTANFEALQDYRDPGPQALGYQSIANVVGAQSPDQTIGHLEGSWHLGHEDVCQMVAVNIVSTPPPGSGWDSWRNHGDAVVGILCGDRNGYGIRGMNNQASLILGSLESGAADMISQCTAAATAGDVFVSSFAWLTDQGFHAPVDWPQAEFDAVNTAAMLGITYCFGAGNTNADLADTAIYGTRYTTGSAESGGIIVGARNSTNADRIGFSNYGSRVDVSAWGENITTVGYGDLFGPDQLQRYTATFGGTSGAGPLVAACAATISGVVREQDDTILTPSELQTLFRTIGTPQGAGGNVGLQPDLVQILANLGLPDGLGIQGDATVGGSATIDCSGDPNKPFLLFVSPNRGRFATSMNRDLLVDASVLVTVTGFVLDGAGQRSLTGPIPNDPGLQDTSVFIQMLDAKAAGGLHLSNSVELYIR
jgi:hypothetical protein